MRIKIKARADKVHLTFTMPREFLVLFEETMDEYLREMFYHLVLNHASQLRGSIFNPLLDGMLEPGKLVLDPAVVEELRADFESEVAFRRSVAA